MAMRTVRFLAALALAVATLPIMSGASAAVASSTATGVSGSPAAGVTLPLPENRLCLDCHGQGSLTAARGGQQVPLHLSADAYDQSAHGVIQCVRCHEGVLSETLDEHQAPNPEALTGRPLRIQVSEECGKCHAGAVLETYRHSFHWAGLELGGQSTASCADCHDAHNALPASDPRSTVAKANLPATCDQTACHPGATPAFVSGTVHTSPQTQQPWSPSRIIWKAFIVLILFDTLKDGPIILFELMRNLRRSLGRRARAGKPWEVTAHGSD